MRLNGKEQDNLNTLSTIFMFCGGLVFMLALFLGFRERAWHAYLLSYLYFLLIALGGLFFISIHYVTKSGWSVNLRKLSEALTCYLPVAFVLTLPLIYGAFFLYDWLDPDKVAGDPLLKHKTPYLNFPFFVIRLVVFFAVWNFFFKKFSAFSFHQDQDGELKWGEKGLKYGILFLLFFSLSLSLFSVDLVMSLDAHWFSTIFGVYVFAGLFQSVFAALILLCAYLNNREPQFSKWVNENHLHDLSKYLFAATVFWAYIAFSQYMLIWYANLPEETTFFVPRSKGSWMWVSLALLVFKFALPFLFLLPRGVKRNYKTMVPIAILILLMQWVDLYWLIYPHFDPQLPRFGILEGAVFLGFFGVFLRVVTSFLFQNNIVPVKDPLLKESLSHKVVY